MRSHLIHFTHFIYHHADECTDKIHDCDQICINVPGAYECDCKPGYKLARDHLSCIDIDECILPNNCADATKCVNTIGSYHCEIISCDIGYEWSPTTNECIDKNECAIDNGGCEQKCVNLDGGSYCKCDVNGFILAADKKHCIESDPCGIKNGGCAHVCESINGIAQCFCYKGFELSASDNKRFGLSFKGTKTAGKLFNPYEIMVLVTNSKRTSAIRFLWIE